MDSDSQLGPVEMVFSVSDFVEYFNQTISYAYSNVILEGEISNFKVSKNRWVYFDLKDEDSSVKFFGSVYNLPGPIEDGMMCRVVGTPKLHNLYGFSISFTSITPVGQGSIKKASDLLRIKLQKEGLFEESRKKAVPTIPTTIGLITSMESAAYKDFIKIVNNRWAGLNIHIYHVGVQGVMAVNENIKAIKYFEGLVDKPEVLVITRGGGSKDDLGVYDDERVVRQVADCLIPTIVGVGHEVDVSLAELVADRRASTPSNAAEMLTPNKTDQLDLIALRKQQLSEFLLDSLKNKQVYIADMAEDLNRTILEQIQQRRRSIVEMSELLTALNPEDVLRRGYAIIRHKGQVVSSVAGIKTGEIISAQLKDGLLEANVTKTKVE